METISEPFDPADPSAFWQAMEELAREVARFEASVDAFCEAAREFKASL